MYLYYEITPGPLGINDLTTITEVVLSKDGRIAGVDWSTKTRKELCNMIIHLFKQVKTENRWMDDSTKIWTFIGASGPIVIASIESMQTQGLFKGLNIKKIENLTQRLERGHLDRAIPKQIDSEEIKFKEEEFFHSAPVSNQLSTEEVTKKLEELLADHMCMFPDIAILSDKELKALYRRAALRYHPDRNNGDGSKMSELNMLWSIFNSGVKI